MKTIEFSRPADNDLLKIYDFLFEATADHSIAFKVIDSIGSDIDRLTKNPELGRRADEIRPSIRSLVSGKYLILYKNLDASVFIVRILHTSRDHSELSV